MLSITVINKLINNDTEWVGKSRIMEVYLITYVKNIGRMMIEALASAYLFEIHYSWGLGAAKN